MGVGVTVSKRTPDRALRTAFAVVVIGVGLAVGWQVLGYRGL